jgi:hypothetical protein
MEQVHCEANADSRGQQRHEEGNEEFPEQAAHKCLYSRTNW